MAVPKAVHQPTLPPRKRPSDQPALKEGLHSFLDAGIWITLIVAIVIVYAQVGHFDFINYDDPQIVYGNLHVRGGLTVAGIKWAFTSVVVGNWMPVTLISHMLDCQLFGTVTGMHHLVNVVFHALAAVLLFLVLRRATGDRWPSAFVAFLFALHPLHVESVAWIAERKDVLSAFFWFLALYAYLRYVERPGPGRYLMVVAPFCLGLMSKPMLVTFPFALLLFDFWPLRRTQFPRILWEKLPLIALSAGASLVTYFVQGSAGAFSPISPGLRIENALTSYVIYIGKMFWPTGLAMFYMYPDSVAAWQVACAAAILLGVSGLALYTWRSHPYFVAGWFWYLGTLVPVIGLVQVGAQARADRYTYIPMVGLLWILAWGAVDVWKQWPRTKLVIASVAVVSCAGCLVLARIQAGYWQNSVTIFQHAVDVTENNFWVRRNLGGAHYDLANSLMEGGRAAEAISHFEEAIRWRPNYPEAQNNLGILFARIPGRTAEAIAHFQAAIELDPKLEQAHRNLGMLLASIPGRAPEAIAQLEAAQRIQPNPELRQMTDRLRAGQEAKPTGLKTKQ